MAISYPHGMGGGGGGGGGGSFANMNPALNNQMAAPENVQVMNVLDQSQTMNVLEQQAMADVGFLEGIPGAGEPGRLTDGVSVQSARAALDCR